MEIQAFAKLNLTLDVLGKRPDGYHDLRMVMQSITLCDTLPLTPIADATEAGNGACQWQAISRLNLNASYQSSFYLHSLTVTLGGTVNRDPDTGLNTVTGGTQVTVTIPAGDTAPDAADPSARGRRLYIARQYTYRLSLLPGACTAIPANGDLDGNDEDMKWDDQGNLLTVPQGYTPIYNEEELRTGGNRQADAPKGCPAGTGRPPCKAYLQDCGTPQRGQDCRGSNQAYSTHARIQPY